MTMCNRSTELDAEIQRYQKLKAGFTDPQTSEAIELLLKRTLAEKNTLLCQ